MRYHGIERDLLLPKGDRIMPVRIAESVLTGESGSFSLAEFRQWLDELRPHSYTQVERVPLSALEGWSSDPKTGNLRHRSGQFFAVEGLDVTIPEGPVSHWTQPIINQPEVGILGILVKDFGGVTHCLLQAKAEPGNYNGLQLSPTVQATRSNYTRVHGGKPVPYLEYFQDASRHRVITDVRQSEQGSWFHHKRNRNMIVEVTEDVEVLDGFCWLTLGQVHRLFAEENLINVDARTVLSCLPFAGADLTRIYASDGDGFRSSLIRSCSEDEGSLHSADGILSWITESRTRNNVYAKRIPLNELTRWYRTEDKISHEEGLFFDVVGLDVTAGGREVGRWMQPVIEPHGTGVVAFLSTVIAGVVHVLVHARAEPGLLDAVELAPTVQCIPESFARFPAKARPRFLDTVLGAGPDQIRFDTVLSEEGGRFYHARNRYLVIEVEADEAEDHPDFRWMTLHQLVALLRHSHYLNIQARSLVACLHSLTGA